MNDLNVLDLNILSEKYASECKGGEYDYFYPEHFVEFCEENELKPIVHGHWNYKSPINGDSYRYCSNCLEIIYDTKFSMPKNFCPNCSAKMGEVE